MDDRKRESPQSQLEDHSLPGTNMAGKGPGDECDSRDDQNSSPHESDRAHRASDEQPER